nr:uncharacterized protein LOC128706505 [Cherax quadricarinatus]
MMKELQQGAETNIPVVDLGEIGVGGPKDPSEEDWRSVGEKLVKAFSEIGFVYLSNHGVSSNMVDEVNTQSGKFFELDETTKLRYKRGKTEVQGYTTPGQERRCGLDRVRDREGTWMNANPILDTVLVNVGDLLQYWTADKLRATEHRVLIPKEEMLKKIPRRSVVFFVHPDNPVLVKPIDGSTSYDPVTVKMHIDKRFEDTYQY